MNASLRSLLALTIAGWLLLAIACVPPEDSGGDGSASPSPGAEGSAAAAPSPGSSPSGTVEADTAEPIRSDEELLGGESLEGGKRNYVKAENRKDGRIRVRTNLQLNKIKGDRVVPENVADAYSSCMDCQSFAVAVQINVYERGATVIAPRNTALAVNDNCLRCVTIARAYQYVIPVDDVDVLPPEVDRLVRAINKEAHYFDKIKDMDDVDPAEIQARLNGVLGQFAELDVYLEAAMAEETEPRGEARTGPTPSAATETPASTVSPGPSATTAETSPTNSPTSVPSSTPSPSPEAATATPVPGTPTASP